MKALVIFDSVFGNTGQIAREIGSALGSAYEVEILQVGEVKPQHLAGLNLLVVGSPTRGFRPTPALKALLRGIPASGLIGVRAAAFDTRLAVSEIKSAFVRALVKFGGYAAKPIADQLKKSGANLVVPPEGFYVKDTEGPLKAGELERSANWARQILAGQ